MRSESDGIVIYGMASTEAESDIGMSIRRISTILWWLLKMMRLSQLLFNITAIAVIAGMFIMGIAAVIDLFAEWLATIIVGL